MKYLFCISFIFFIAFTIPLLAHETKTANPLSILLHIEPDDDPIAGEPAEIFFAFTDETQVFDISTCDCVAMVKDQDHTLFEGAVTRTEESLYGKNVASVTTVFPQTGVYHITISALPRNNASFEKTVISYDVEIKRSTKKSVPIEDSSEQKEANAPWVHVYGMCAGCIVILGAGFLAFRQYRKRVV